MNEEPVCSGCPDSDKCRQVWSMPNRGPFTSGGLLLSSILAFLLPILTAIIAGAVAHWARPAVSESPWWVIVAALVGLFVGVIIARLLMPLIKKYFSKPENFSKISH